MVRAIWNQINICWQPFVSKYRGSKLLMPLKRKKTYKHRSQKRTGIPNGIFSKHYWDRTLKNNYIPTRVKLRSLKALQAEIQSQHDKLISCFESFSNSHKLMLLHTQDKSCQELYFIFMLAANDVLSKSYF